MNGRGFWSFALVVGRTHSNVVGSFRLQFSTSENKLGKLGGVIWSDDIECSPLLRGFDWVG
jgi:hypothetical protein